MYKHKLSNNATFVITECSCLGESQGNVSQGAMAPSYTDIRELRSTLTSNEERHRRLQNVSLTAMRFAAQICKEAARKTFQK